MSEIIDFDHWKMARQVTEKRRHERLILSRTTSCQITAAPGKSWIAVEVIELSRGGCLLSVGNGAVNLSVDQRGYFRIWLDSGLSLDLPFEVKHLSCPIDDRTRTLYGFSFVGASEVAQNLLSAYLTYLGASVELAMKPKSFEQEGA